jgi:putative ABC transport system permease protein
MGRTSEGVRRVMAFLRAAVASVPNTTRSLRRAPGFVAIATLSLGAALGLSTSVFALIDSMRHPRSPYRDVDQLYVVFVYQFSRQGPSSADVEQALRGLKGVAGVASARAVTADIEVGDGVVRANVVHARPGYFPILEIRPRRGRLPTADDMTRGDIALVSDALWRSEFGDRVHTEGAMLIVAGRQYAIIGVMPDGAAAFSDAQVWIPETDVAGSGAGTPFVRLAHGAADTASVKSQLHALSQRWTAMYTRPGERPFSVKLFSLRPDPLALKDFHVALIGAAVCVLLIACANVSALMLARGVVRRRDYALRLALGAGREEIAREVILEVAALAVAGCVAGALVATWAIGLITRATPDELRWQEFVQPHWSLRVLALSGLAVLVSVAVAGGFPAWRASRIDPMTPLKEGSGGNTGRAGTRFRWLVMAELALSMTLVMGASLMMKSANKMAAYDFGYDARSLLAVDIFIWYRDTTAPAVRARAYEQLLSRVKSLPGVRDAASYSPCGYKYSVVTSDRTIEGGAAAFVPNGCFVGSAGLFRTLGIEMADGRDFIDGDNARDGAAILDERTARRLFPHERAVGRMVKLGDAGDTLPWLPVVGVVRNRELQFNRFPETGPDTTSRVYATLPLSAHMFGDLIIRPEPGSRGIEAGVSRAIRATLPPRSWSHIRPWVQGYRDDLRSEQFLSLLFTLLGIASLALGAAGLFSVISYIAGQRMREFAVRIALGATNGSVLRLVMKDALLMALGGTAAGAGLGMWAGFLLWDKMWGVYPVDAQALMAGEATLLLVTMLGCLVPALRATRADPVEVLRAA